MVGGLVEHQHVRLLQHELAEQQPRGFATGEHVGALVAVVARKQHLPQQAANLFVGCARVPAMQPFERRHSFFDQRAVVLREISDGRFVSPDDLAVAQERAVVAAGLAQLSFRNGRRVGQQRIQQRRLARAVAAHQRDLFAAQSRWR